MLCLPCGIKASAVTLHVHIENDVISIEIHIMFLSPGQPKVKFKITKSHSSCQLYLLNISSTCKIPLVQCPLIVGTLRNSQNICWWQLVREIPAATTVYIMAGLLQGSGLYHIQMGGWLHNSNVKCWASWRLKSRRLVQQLVQANNKNQGSRCKCFTHNCFQKLWYVKSLIGYSILHLYWPAAI